jgi:hypothetical protein
VYNEVLELEETHILVGRAHQQVLANIRRNDCEEVTLEFSVRRYRPTGLPVVLEHILKLDHTYGDVLEALDRPQDHLTCC